MPLSASHTILLAHSSNVNSLRRGTENMNPLDSHKFEQIISKPRLDSYKGYFSVNKHEAIGLYVWNSEVSGCWSALMAYFEIALRNSIHREMSLFYSARAATVAAAAAGAGTVAAAAAGAAAASPSFHWYDAIASQLKSETNKKIFNVRHKRGSPPIPIVPPPSPDEIVSRVSFGFWPAILTSINSAHADKLFPKIFPGHPLNANPLDWKNSQKCKKALAYIFELNALRNRIAHHEPLWRFAEVKDTSVHPNIVLAAQSMNQVETMARFERLQKLFADGIGALNQDLLTDIQQSSVLRKLGLLLSTRGLNRYKKRKHFPAAGHLTPANFRKQFSLLSKENQPVRIGRSGIYGVFDPE
jgi:hypothetical protein